VIKQITLISGIFPPETGGPARFAFEFSNWLVSHRKNVCIVTYGDRGFITTPTAGITLNLVRRTKLVLIRYLLSIFIIGKSVRKNSPVLAVGAFIETYLSSLIFKFDYVVKVPGDIVWERAKNNKVTDLSISDFQSAELSLKYKTFRMLFSQSLKRANTVIVPSKGLFDLCISWGVNENKLQLIYNSVTMPDQISLSSINHKFNLVTVCRLTSWKGVDEIIKYASDSGLSLAIAGSGPEREKLESLAKKLSANVHFLGEVSPIAVQELLIQSQVFVLNSSYEGLPHALIEARASGVLSVGRAGTGSEEVIHDGIDGLLIRPDRNLVETLDLVFEGKIDALRFISNATSDTRERFDQDINFRLIVNVLEKQ